MKLIFMILTLVIAAACGKQDDDDKNNSGKSPELTLTPSEQLSSEWSGIYRALEDGKPISDAASATAIMQASGNFAVTLDGDPTARIEGQWSEFQGKTLILKISGSTMPRIGSTGKVIEPGYELLGSSLRIFNNTFELKLSKKSSAASGQAGNSDKFGYPGSWLCSDTSGRRTKILVSETSEFKLSSVGRGERAFVAQGATAIVAGNALRLNPISTSDAIQTGSYFELQQAGMNSELVFYRAGSYAAKLGTCKK